MITDKQIINYFDLLSKYAQQCSDDTTTKNGAMIVSVLGEIVLASNRFPPGVQVSSIRQAAPDKYYYITHAEQSAIAKAARSGLRTEGAMMIALWAACSTCAKLIADAGITTMITHEATIRSSPKEWVREIEIGNEILREAGVRVISFRESIPNAFMEIRGQLIFLSLLEK